MSVLAEIRFRSPDVALAPTLAGVPTVRLDLVAEVATDPERPLLYLWARGDDLAGFEAALSGDPTVADVERYTRHDGRGLYRVQVSDATPVVCYGRWVEAGATLLQVRWREERWHARVRFPDRDALGDLRRWCAEREIEFALDRVVADDGHPHGEGGLTSPQRQVLVTAHELGYFEVPREATMADVAAELGISSQAVSERLRRGFDRLVGATVASPNGGP